MGEPIDVVAKAIAADAVLQQLAESETVVHYIDVSVASNPVAG